MNLQSSVNNVVELRFDLFKHLLHFSLLTEETIRLACPSLEQQTLKYLIFRGLSFTFAKEQSISKVNEYKLLPPVNPI